VLDVFARFADDENKKVRGVVMQALLYPNGSRIAHWVHSVSDEQPSRPSPSISRSYPC
jgi:hypothetical protein